MISLMHSHGSRDSLFSKISLIREIADFQSAFFSFSCWMSWRFCTLDRSSYRSSADSNPSKEV